ncbi:MAG: CapA family protein [Bacilli bacterium]
MYKSFFERNKFKLLLLFFLIMVLFLVVLVGYCICFFVKDSKIISDNKDEDSYVSISYVGDLILLKDQVKFSYDSVLKKYNFDYMFEKAKSYFSESDYTIGVFEGPVSNSKLGYSTSNYGDGNKIYLGYPTEFADAVKSSGIDFVSTANNHLMDKGKKGVFNTIDYLDKIGLNHTGSYKSVFDKNKVKIINVKGVKIAVLSYTISSNYYNSDYFIYKEPSLTSVLVSENDKNFQKVKEMVRKDFELAKKSSVDLILVMPHMGTQFIHETNKMQDEWNDIFVSYGADIILGDHSHATQPVLFEGDTLIVNCPGNFANSYIKDDGDATSIVEFYINKKTKKVDKASIVPMYTKEISDGKYQATPIYDIYEDNDLYNTFAGDDLKRANDVHGIVTYSMINKKVDISQLQKRYFVYKNENVDLDLSSVLEKSTLKSYLDNASSVSFIGDSITSGIDKNDYKGWYLPLMKLYPDISFNNISHGSYTTKDIVNKFSSRIEKSNSDVYFIALGVNDIRYRDEKKCSMDSSEYIKNIDKIVKLIGNKKAKIVLIAPWYSLINDKVSKIDFNEKNEFVDDYSSALESYALDNNFIYIDANNYIEKFFDEHNAFDYYVDYIHPNSSKGIELYSYAVVYDSIKK